MEYYPGIANKPIGPYDYRKAYKLYKTIPPFYTREYAEAQFWIAKLICHHNNFTPENFDTETAENKLERLSAMKPL